MYQKDMSRASRGSGVRAPWPRLPAQGKGREGGLGRTRQGGQKGFHAPNSGVQAIDKLKVPLINCRAERTACTQVKVVVLRAVRLWRGYDSKRLVPTDALYL